MRELDIRSRDGQNGEFGIFGELNYEFRIHGDSMKKTVRLVLETIAAFFVIFVFYFVQGAIVVTQGFDGANAKWIQSVFIWASVIVALAFFLIKDKSLKNLGFRKVDGKGFCAVLFCLPVLLVALSGLVYGIELSGNGIVLANLVLTIGIGFSEEIYFRGIILHNWLNNRGKTPAIIISAALFGLTHLMNILGGAGLAVTIMQIFFALFYGIIMAIILIRTNSIWPCIILHFMHDFCSWTGMAGPPKEDTILAAAQTVVLLIYMVYLIDKEKNTV